VAGFASISPYRDRPAYRTTVENWGYVHEDFRGQGVGQFHQRLDLGVVGTTLAPGRFEGGRGRFGG
jgi:GNAT superfamily N-acetyltransferase